MIAVCVVSCTTALSDDKKADTPTSESTPTDSPTETETQTPVVTDTSNNDYSDKSAEQMSTYTDSELTAMPETTPTSEPVVATNEIPFRYEDVLQVTSGLETVGDYIDFLKPQYYSMLYNEKNGIATIRFGDVQIYAQLPSSVKKYATFSASDLELAITIIDGAYAEGSNDIIILPESVKQASAKLACVSWDADSKLPTARGINSGAKKDDVLNAFLNTKGGSKLGDRLYTYKDLDLTKEWSNFIENSDAPNFWLGGSIEPGYTDGVEEITYKCIDIPSFKPASALCRYWLIYTVKDGVVDYISLFITSH